MIIAVDFDGTLIKDGFPDVREGTPNVTLFSELARMRESGHQVILWTCRGGDLLQEAVDFCRMNGLEFDAVNDNLPEALQAMKFGHAPRKVFADIYIDDQSIKPRWSRNDA